MSVISSYAVSASNPAVVGGVGGTIKYFSSGPTPNLWNSGTSGVGARVDSSQIGNTPSATSALGQLSPIADGKLTGGRFRIYASGSASSVNATPTISPIVQINTGTIQSPSYSTLIGGVASANLTANKPLIWTIGSDLFFDPNNGILDGVFKYRYTAVPGGTGSFTGNETAIAAPITGLSQSAGSVGGQTGQPGFGFVVGITFGVSDSTNSASLYEFKIIQD